MTRRRWAGLGVFLTLALVALGQVHPATASSWPRFRGPNGTGISTDKDIPVHWTAQEVLWKTAIPGLGNSSPVTWGSRVFLQSSSDDGRQRFLVCLDAESGKILWTRSVPGAPAAKHSKNTLASSTPATDGERVYALFWDGTGLTLRAYDMQGNPAWQHELGAYTAQHGAGASPVVYGNKVFFLNDQDGSAEILALDARTGKVAWQAPRQAHRACYSSPFLLEAPGKPPQLIVASTGGITAYEPATGHEIWQYNWTFARAPLRTVASPLAGPGMIIANSGDGNGERLAVAIRPDSSGKGVKPKLVWEQSRTLPYVPTMLVSGDYIFFVNDLGVAGCLAAESGRGVWNERLGGKVSASPVLIDGKVYATNEDGVTYVFEAAPTFKLLAKNPLGQAVLASPAVADHRLFIRGDKHLFCIGKPAGDQATQH